MSDSVSQFINNEEVFLPTLIASSIVICIVFKSITGLFSRIAQERTRREIAAYIAEGSMSPEQGERLMKAGKRRDHSCG